jgi:hypothetical protein
MLVGKSDLAFLKEGKGDGEGEENKEGGEINEEMLMEMCKFSNMSTSNSVKKQADNGMIERSNKGYCSGFAAKTTNITEDFDLNIDGDEGVNGRPRVREEEKPDPGY